MRYLAEIENRLALYRRRKDCHGTYWCCQYIDTPLCNGSLDPHRIARLRRWIQQYRDHLRRR